MKELLIKERAKAYDGLIERLKDLKFAYRFSPLSDTIEEKFPELKESEDGNTDEKVRKALIKLVTNYASMDLFIEYDIHLDEALSWLEKQRDKDKLIQELGEYKVKYTQEVLRQHLEKQGGQNLDNSAKNCKDGQKPKEKTKIYDSMDDLIADALIEEIEGSELDDRGKYNRIHWIESHRQKHTWSEDDKKMFVNIKACLRNANKDYSREIDWLKSIKPQPKNEWSEEDERERKRVVGLLEGWLSTFKETCYAEDCKCGIVWLKSLKPQPKQEWSVEDRSKIQRICTYLNEAKKYYADITEVRECINWLKSLKDRTQPQWKPSKEQMKQLNSAANIYPDSRIGYALRSLYQDLVTYM